MCIAMPYRLLVPLVFSFSFLISLLVGCGTSADPPADPQPAPRVEIARAVERTRALPIHTTGRLASKAEIPLSFTIDGVIDRILVDEGEVVRLALGDSAHVLFDAHPDQPVEAQITEIADAANPQTGTFEIELSIDDPGVSLKSGFIATARLQPSEAADYVEIPAAALVEGDGQDGIVFTVDAAPEADVQRTWVRMAEVLDSTVVLTSGLAPDTRVVTTGAVGLRDGETVRVSNED